MAIVTGVYRPTNITRLPLGAPHYNLPVAAGGDLFRNLPAESGRRSAASSRGAAPPTVRRRQRAAGSVVNSVRNRDMLVYKVQ